MAAGKNITIRPPKSKTTLVFTERVPTSREPRKLDVRSINTSRQRKRKQDDFLRRFNRRIRDLKIELDEQQRNDEHQTIEKELVEISIVSGSILTRRDEDGNIILFEDAADPNLNVERHDQFVSVELYDDIFDINAAIDAVDFSVIELKSVDNRIDLIENFLNTFRTVLPEIPDGDLQFILRRGVEEQGGELVGQEEFDKLTNGRFSTIIQRLIDCEDKNVIDSDEIGGLSSQVDNLTLQLEAMGDLVLEASTNDAGLNLPTLIRFVANELARRRITSGDTTVLAQRPVSIIKVRAHRFLDNILGQELCRADKFFEDGGFGSGRRFPPKEDESLGGRRPPNPHSDPKAAERDEMRRRRQQNQKELLLEKAERIAAQGATFNKRRLVDVTFLTQFSEATTLKMTIPFDVRVPTLTNVHGFPELVTGVRFKLNDAGSFKGWFRDDLKVADGQEFVTEQLDPNTRFTLKAAIESFEAPNENLPDDTFPPGREIDELTREELLERRQRILQREIDRRREEMAMSTSPIEKEIIEEELEDLVDQMKKPVEEDVQVVTLPEPPEPMIPDDSLDVVMPPMKELKPKVGIGTGLEKPGSGLTLDPDPPPKPAGDPDEPILPLEDDEIEVVQLEEEKSRFELVMEDTMPASTPGGEFVPPMPPIMEDEFILPNPDSIPMPVVDVTPVPIKNTVIVIPPKGGRFGGFF